MPDVLGLTEVLGTKTPRGYESFWKGMALFLAGACLSGIGAWSTYVRTAVTSQEVQAMIDQNNKPVQIQIDSEQKQLDQMNGKLDYIIENPDRPRKR